MLQQRQPVDRVFHALADPHRRVIVERLSRGPATVSELAQPLPMSLSAVVQHLKVLQVSGLVRSEMVEGQHAHRHVHAPFTERKRGGGSLDDGDLGQVRAVRSRERDRRRVTIDDDDAEAATRSARPRHEMAREVAATAPHVHDDDGSIGWHVPQPRWRLRGVHGRQQGAAVFTDALGEGPALLLAGRDARFVATAAVAFQSRGLAVG